jgi:hypothetical protein
MNNLNLLTLKQRRAIVNEYMTDGRAVGKNNSYKLGVSNIGMNRVYQGDLLVGSSTWLMWYGIDLETHEGWNVLHCQLPPQYFGHNVHAYHAYKAGWTTKEVSFHFYDHNCAQDIFEIKEAIDYWNSNPEEGGV